ncbi:hypothetical protein FXB41_29890 [Bradyrhizobium canariense]|uniref:hypothetical protein n=1 Tax=Bradyrhizobium canariense TaxID=255045 RepID=UPI001CA5C86E|nr:hypothetical protein [Bradyrhizobium canariense]MBW5438821.1 hypothetical protein [Bradyrhizobium canariense]
MIAITAIAGVLWSSGTLPLFWSLAPARELMARILVGDRFKQGAMDDVLGPLEARSVAGLQHPDFERARALISLTANEDALARNSREDADRKVDAAETRVRQELTLNPADSFLWLMLYSVALARRGFDDSCLGYLDQSYSSGPLEGWIALRRNRLALAAFPTASAATQAKVVSEFAGMVDTEFTEAAAFNLMGVGWEQRERLLASLANMDMVPREAFAKALAREGLKLSVPGVELEERLWRR